MKGLKRLLASVFVAVAALLMLTPPQVAQAASSSALSIPPKKSYVIEPGKSVKDTLTIRNLDNTAKLELSLRLVDFTYEDNTTANNGGTARLMLDPQAPQTTWSLKPFATLQNTLTIEPGSSKTIPFKVTIPSNQGAGSYYSAIMYSTGAPDGGNVGLAASGVTLVFVNVPGKVKESLELQKFGAYSDTEGGFEYFAVNQPHFMAYTLKNSGNVAESPVGAITIKGMFGQKYEIDNINPNGSLALIGQTRTFTSCIKYKDDAKDNSATKECVDPGFWPGLYTATIDLFYGQNGNQTQEIVKTAHFWYLPWWFIITSIAVIVYLTYQIWKLTNKIRNRLYGPRLKKISHRRR